MPFDSLPVTYPELRAFRDKLRDPGAWPEGFKWNFAGCRTCAMGLLGVVADAGPAWETGFEPYQAAAAALDISARWADWLFSGQVAFRRNIWARDVTADMIADDIDYLLANGL